VSNIDAKIFIRVSESSGRSAWCEWCVLNECVLKCLCCLSELAAVESMIIDLFHQTNNKIIFHFRSGENTKGNHKRESNQYKIMPNTSK